MSEWYFTVCTISVYFDVHLPHYKWLKRRNYLQKINNLLFCTRKVREVTTGKRITNSEDLRKNSKQQQLLQNIGSLSFELIRLFCAFFVWKEASYLHYGHTNAWSKVHDDCVCLSKMTEIFSFETLCITFLHVLYVFMFFFVFCFLNKMNPLLHSYFLFVGQCRGRCSSRLLKQGRLKGSNWKGG